MQTAAAYIRVSDARQDEYSPDSQLKLIRSFSAKNGYDVPDDFIFYDDGISGATSAKRPAFNNMISLAKEKDPPFSAILVWKFSRFARNQEESIVFKKMLKKNGVSVISVSEPISEDPFGGLIERIIEWMDEYYLIRLGPEVKRGMLERASRGEVLCKAPLGYKNDPQNHTYVPDPETAALIPQIFDSFIRGEGMKAIAVRLNAAGVRTTRGNPLENRTIEYILNNPVYLGKVRWSKEGRSASRRQYDAEGILLTDGHHPPLITEDQFEAAQKRLKEYKRMYKKYQRPEDTKDWMLKGLVRCSACGATLIRTNQACPSMQCHNYAHGKCTVSHSLSIAKANRLLVDALDAAIPDGQLKIAPLPAEAERVPLPDFEKQLAAEQKKLDRLNEAYLGGVYTLDQMRQLKTTVDAAIAEIRRQIDAAKAAPPAYDAAAFAERIATVRSFILSPAPESAKAEALRSIISDIIYNKPAGTLTLHFYY